ncbi:MAG TPA: nitroreductase family protein [Bacillota bacterium]|nr:nitroreductase family protein [Bacillota bacterium]
MTKDVMDAIRQRKSVRSFKSDPIDEATLGRIMEAALQAPSGGNLQPWTFYVVFNQELRQQLARAAGNQNSVNTAPVSIVVCALPEESAARYGDRGRYLYCLQDTAAATMNLMLAAEGFGYATCWVGAFDESAVADSLGLPGGQRPVVIIPLGFSGETGETKYTARKSFDEVVKAIR